MVSPGVQEVIELEVEVEVEVELDVDPPPPVGSGSTVVEPQPAANSAMRELVTSVRRMGTGP
jgi:hypothetical protein